MPSSSRARSKRTPPRILAGYVLSLKDFKSMIRSIPRFSERKARTLSGCLDGYHSVRGVPPIEIITDEPEDAKSDAPEKFTTSILFPRRRFFDEEKEKYGQEGPSDLRALNAFADLIQIEEGGTLDTSKAEWKIVHPMTPETLWGYLAFGDG